MIVVDASAVVDALTLAPGSEGLRDRLRGEELHAPMLIDYEVVSALRGLVLGKHLGASRGDDALTDYTELPLYRWEGTAVLRRRAFELRASVSAYDAAYIALAEALESALITRDGRLARTTGHAARVEVS